MPPRRRRFRTGQQEQCAQCTRLGTSREGAGSAPLCERCWRGNISRARVPELIARLQARAAERRALAELRAASPAPVALPALVVEAEPCQACGHVDPDAACWLCGPVWLAELRERFEEDQAAAEREHRLADEETREQLAQERAALTAAEARVELLTDWTEKLARVVSEYEAGRGYVVELVAEAMYRADAARQTRRGRPSALPAVALVMAADRDPRTGGTTLPGRDLTAELAGCSVRAVTSAWQALKGHRWHARVRRGGLTSLDVRTETGRTLDRAEFRVRLLHRDDCAHHGPHMAAAAVLAAATLARTATLLEQAQADLEALRRRSGTRTRPAEGARRLQLRHAVRTALTGPKVQANICTSSGGITGENASSGLSLTLGSFSAEKLDQSDTSGHRPVGREGLSGASPTSQSCDDLEWGCRPAQRPQRPRTPSVSGRRSRRRPAWLDWALPLAHQLRHLWDFLQGERVDRVAATLGGRLAPALPDGDPWTAERLADLAEAGREGRPLMVEPRYRLAYLRSVLDGLPDRYRRPDRVRAEQQSALRDQAAEQAARRDERTREHEGQAAAVAASDPRRGQVLRRLARYVIRPTDTAGRCVGCDTSDQVAPRRHGRADVPLCGPCWQLLDHQDDQV